MPDAMVAFFSMQPGLVYKTQKYASVRQILRQESILDLSIIPLVAKFPHSPILYYACRLLLTENNGKNNATAVGQCAIFVVSWWKYGAVRKFCQLYFCAHPIFCQMQCHASVDFCQKNLIVLCLSKYCFVSRNFVLLPG